MDYMNSGSGTMKLQKFEEKNQQKKGILLFSICCIFLIAGIFIYQSFALFQVKGNFNVLNGNVEDPGDLYFAYYVDDKITQDMPTKNSGYTLSEKSFCNNGVTILWDDEEWMAKVYYKNYSKENTSRTKCTLYFEEKPNIPELPNPSKDYIISNVPEDQIILDDGTEDHNMRFIGANPNNYIYFNCDDPSNPTSETCDLWRIIGFMNNIDNGEGKLETRIKLISNEVLGSYSWDSSSSSINYSVSGTNHYGYGVNEWSQADAMKLMNPGYETEATGGSLYWHRAKGRCFNSYSNGSTACDFSKIGFKNNTKNLFENAVWHTGAISGTSSVSTMTAHDFYEQERGDNTGKICSSAYKTCNDEVERTTKWTGQVGLLSLSDYEFATGGSESTMRITCLQNAAVWSDYTDCYKNDWLFTRNNQWTMVPRAVTKNATEVFYIYANGSIYYTSSSSHPAATAKLIMPVIYLKSNVKIISGEGTVDSPFAVTIE